MSHRAYSLVAALLFSLIVVGHLVRLLFRVPWVVADWTVPMWMSVVGIVIAGFMAFAGFRLSRKP
jgi:hypothetical protein